MELLLRVTFKGRREGIRQLIQSVFFSVHGHSYATTRDPKTPKWSFCDDLLLKAAEKIRQVISSVFSHVPGLETFQHYQQEHENTKMETPLTSA